MKTVLIVVLALVCSGMGATVADSRAKARAAADAATQLLRVETWGGGALTFRAPKGWTLVRDADDNGTLISPDRLTTITFITNEDEQKLYISAHLEMIDLGAGDQPDIAPQPKVSGREALRFFGPSAQGEDLVRIDLLAIRLDTQHVAFAYATTPWGRAKAQMLGGGNSRLPGVRVLESIRVATPGRRGKEAAPTARADTAPSAPEFAAASRAPAAAVVATTAASALATDERILQSYRTAFCRDPHPDEASYWRGDPRSASLDGLIAAHRAWLKKTPADRQAMITRSYLTEFQRSPHADEMVFWDGQVVEKGYTCGDLLALHESWKKTNMAGAPH